MPREKIDSVDGSGFTVQAGWSGGTMQVATEVSPGTSIVRQLYEDREVLLRIGRRAVRAGWVPIPVDADLDSESIAEVHRAAGLAVLDVVEGLVSDTSGYREDEYRGLWATLDRHGANRLIRILRKARDSAFGKDE